MLYIWEKDKGGRDMFYCVCGVFSAKKVFSHFDALCNRSLCHIYLTISGSSGRLVDAVIGHPH